jgi:glycosyltransferase involved in cell wall biosynthesis
MSIDISNPIKLIKDFGILPKNPKLSIIIVTWNNGNELIKCLEELENQTDRKFEIIIADNGNCILSNYEGRNLKYIQLTRNFRPSFARNICLKFARAGIVAFLDDDAFPDQKWVENILNSFENNKIIALRGKILPKSSQNIYNFMAGHYDLGKAIIPSFIDLEGNCAFNKNKLLGTGGFNPQMFGFEGIELTYRIIGDKNIFLSIYDPSVIIYHDAYHSLFHFLSKNIRHTKNLKILKKQNPELTEYIQKYISLWPKQEDIYLSFTIRQRLLFLKIMGVMASILGSFISLFLYRRVKTIN